MTETKRKNISGVVLSLGMVLILIGAVIPFFHIELSDSRLVLAAGAALALAARFLEPVISAKENLRLSRLQRMDKVTAVIFCLSAACLFVKDNPEVTNAWVPLLMAASVLQIYCTLMTNHELKKIVYQEPRNSAKKKKNAKKR